MGDEVETERAGAARLPAGGGEMGTLVRAFDWSTTPLGAIERWPQSLRTVVGVVLTSRFAMWMGWGPDLTFLYNDAYGAMTLARKHPWALGKPAREVWAEIWTDLSPRVRTVMESGVATWDEALQLFLERSGYLEETYHTFSYSPLTGDDGVVAGMLCVVSEETERVIGERRLASLRDLASALAAARTESEVLASASRSLGASARDLPFALVYLFDDDRACARLAAWAGAAPGHAVAPETFDIHDCDAYVANAWPANALAVVAAGGAPVVVDDLATRFDEVPRGSWAHPPTRATIVPIAKQGQERPAGFLIAGVNPYRPFDDAYAGFVGLVAGQIASSLANARAYADERRRAEALAELDRAKTAFFSNVSHEFRTPLTLMLGPSEDTLRDPETLPVDRERAAVIHRNALRLLKLVNTMLDFSRIEAGRVHAAYEPTDLATATAELASTFRSAVERAGLSLVVDCPPLPTPVYVDRDMWEKVVLNLLSNALKHTFEGEIVVRLRADGDRVVLTVHDTGTGIPAEQLPRVFERFHRVPNARSRTHEGTGIGLALVQELVKLHGGTIGAESTVGVGTTFRVAVPFGVEHLPAEHLRAPADTTRAAAGAQATAFVEEALRWLPTEDDGAVPNDDVPGTAPVRILVADDNADVREYVARLLRERGWSVETVSDGATALERAHASMPDLVLSDVMMPGLDGFALVHALREDPQTRSVPVILLSARAGEEARVEGIAAGAADYLVKPFSARELVARIEAHVQRASEAAEERRTMRERERLLAAVQAERARLQELFAQAPAAIAVLRGPDHVFESANAHYLQLVGGRAVVGKPIREALPELEGQGIFELLDGVLTTGAPYVGHDLRAMVLDHEGVAREHFFTFVYQPLREDGEVVGVFVHAVDVTDQVRGRQAAEQANRAKSDFLAAMSHELRTPLNAIGGYVQLLELGIHGSLTDAQREALRRIERSEQHLLALINDVLNFARLEAGRVEYAIETVALTDAVADIEPIVAPLLSAKGLAYDADVATGIAVRADPDKLQQILLNLVSNAVKFTPTGGRVNVDMPDGARSDGVVALRVTDTGIGIARDKQDAIFDPFVQVHRQLTRTTDGTGLGLAISRDLARGMGGDLVVHSDEGQGAAFTLTLPRA